MHISYSVSSSPFKVWANVFPKNALHGGKTFFGQLYGGIFYIEINDQVMEGGS